MSAYEDVCKIFRTLDPGDDPEYAKFAGYMKKAASDAHAVVLETGIDMVTMFLSQAEIAGRFRSQVTPALIDKGLPSARTSTRSKAQEALLTAMEIDTPEPVIVRGPPHLRP